MTTPRIPIRGARFIDPAAERMRGRSALEALRGYAGAPSQASVMHPGSAEGYESGELAGMAEMLIPGAAMAKGALGAALVGVIKPRGGNWLESGLGPILQDMRRGQYAGPGDEANDLLQSMNAHNAAINRWIEGPLTKYLKRDIGTEQDPVRRLFDEGVSHVPPESLMDYRDMANADLALKRQMLDQPREPLSSGEGQYWENLVDEMIVGGPASEYTTPVSPAWMQKDPTAAVYHFGPSTWSRPFPENALGLSHITDELDNSLMGEAGGLPRKFWLTPEKMEQMGMERAVRHVDEINKWRAEQKIAANRELANKALAVRGYPDTPGLPNPKGLRWVELGKDTPDLEKQLKYEGDTMGHCVGGYCPDVLEGKSRIFSLRDAKGEPHVTVEVKPAGEWVGRPGAVDENPIIKNEWPEFYRDLVRRVNGNPSPGDIATFKDYMLSKYPDDQSVASFFGPAFKIEQIKGKANKRPKDEYLPFVQDFVRNNPLGARWNEVRDVENTGLRRSTDLWNENERRRIREAGVEIPDYVTGGEMKDINIRVWPDDAAYSSAPKWFADGGVVGTPDNWRRMELGGTIGYLMEG